MVFYVKLKFDLACLNRFSNDNWIELIKLQEHYSNTILDKHINGYIQSLSYNPFIVHLYSENQIKILKLFKNKRNIVHLDATGSIIRKIDSSQKKVFYYALTVGHPDYSTSPVPIAEMISSAHSSAEITYFLHKWALEAKKIVGSELNIGQIEIDYSWALIHSVCSAFLKCDLETYLNKCWTKIEFDPEGEFINYNIIIHLCSAHLLNGICYHVNKKFKLNKNVRKLLLFSVGYIVCCTDINKINNVFRSLCIVFLSGNLDDNVTYNILNLESHISNDSYTIEDIILEDDSEYNPFENDENRTYREKSPFGRHFAKILKKCNEIVGEVDSNIELNPNYNPKVIEYLLSYYMPLLPLWSGIILDHTMQRLVNHVPI